MNQSIAYSLWSIVKPIFFCILSSALLILSFPRTNIRLFAWFGFVPLFFALQNKPPHQSQYNTGEIRNWCGGKSKAKAFLVSYITGIIFWFGTIYWLIHVTFVGIIVLVLYLALYFGIFGLIISYYLTLNPYHLTLLISSLWVLLEYLRSHLFTGFPWALLGYSQYLNLPVIQIADITGVWGVSFLVMMINVLIYKVMRYASCAMRKKQKKSLSITYFILSLLILFLSLGYGFYRLRTTHNTERATVRISVIQGNIPQELKWEAQARNEIMHKYLDLTAKAVKDNPDLIIWPEAAMPVVLEEEPEFFKKLSLFIKEIKIPLLLGAVTYKDNSYYNSALLVSNEGRLLNRYDKLHLVPFGEYIPLRKIFRFLETVVPIGDFTAGKDYTVFELPTADYRLPITFSNLVCFEDIFPELARRFIKKGDSFLVNITNDAWFGETSSPYQHLCASVFRAVENRAPLVRAANTGVSGFISPTGRIISLVKDNSGKNIFIDGYDTQEIVIPQNKNISFYTQYGDMFILICFLLVLYDIILKIKNYV